MVKKKEKSNVQNKTEKKSIEKSKPSRVLRPLDIWEDINRLLYDKPGFFPWLGAWEYRLPQFGKYMDDDTKYIPMDLIENNNEYKIIAEMPGISKKNIEVKITNDSISICGITETDVKDEVEGYIQRERTYSNLCRTLRFPEEVNPDKAEATLNDGILEITVQKINKAKKGRTIAIK